MSTDKDKSFKDIASIVTNVIKKYSLNSQIKVDERFKTQLATSIYLLTHTYVLLNSIANNPDQDKIADDVFESQIIIWQACNTAFAALQLVRQGYPLEPQFLMRTTVESLALAMSFHIENEAYSKYKKGELSGEKCIKPSKKVIREIGQIYGLLSKATHPSRETTGNNYNEDNAYMIIGGGYTEKLSHRVLFNFSLLNYLLLSVWKGSEFIFYEFEGKPKFWSRNKNSYNLKLDESIKKLVVNIEKDFKKAISMSG